MDEPKKSSRNRETGTKDDRPERPARPIPAAQDAADDPDSKDWVEPDLPASLNEELEKQLGDNPDKFIGCGG